MTETQEAGASLPPEEAFIDACRFAKLVTTPNGPGMLIDGMVFQVLSPMGNQIDTTYPDYTDWLVRALRRTAYAHGDMQSGVIATARN